MRGQLIMVITVLVEDKTNMAKQPLEQRTGYSNLYAQTTFQVGEKNPHQNLDALDFSLHRALGAMRANWRDTCKTRSQLTRNGLGQTDRSRLSI